MSQDPIRAAVLYSKALAAAHLGMIEEARRSALEGLSLSHETGAILTMLLNQTVLGFLELSLDHPSTAHEWLGPLVRWVDVISVRDPGILRFVPDEAEALVALGALDDADGLLSRYDADARRLGRPAALLGVARARAMLCASSGDPARGAVLLQGALNDWADAVPRFDRARARLVLGTVLRRTLRRREARDALEEALGGFGELGAELWVERTERILGGQPEEPSLDVLQPLTLAERRVAELVAGGATNRAAADQLFVSVRAVEVHLTSIYRKLRIRSRTELAALLARAEARQIADPANLQPSGASN
jgi:DNA-binding CsgD family transcriptional regulator